MAEDGMTNGRSAMVVYKEGTNVEVIDPDLDSGRLIERSVMVGHVYVVDVAEEVEEYVIAEYPETGGKDVGYRVVVPEKGHWETFDEGGKRVPFDGEIDDGWPKDSVVPDLWTFAEYHVYTDEELAAISEGKAEEEAARKKAEEREEMLESLPDELESADAALCELYEISLEQQGVMDEQDAAICELYEMIGGF